MTRSELETLANSSTRDRRRAEHMGWRFSPVKVQALHGDYLSLEGSFCCVCGTIEHFSFMLNGLELEQPLIAMLACDTAARLRQGGSFSKDHLLADGYAPADVDRIMRLGYEFDQAESLATRQAA